MRRKICIVTGIRAEYGLLYWLMKEIQEDSDLELQIIVTGIHPILFKIVLEEPIIHPRYFYFAQRIDPIHDQRIKRFFTGYNFKLLRTLSYWN
jgi:UDP-N-acetylglucosamine 2-epimerase